MRFLMSMLLLAAVAWIVHCTYRASITPAPPRRPAIEEAAEFFLPRP